jgi:hypothetical protein
MPDVSIGGCIHRSRDSYVHSTTPLGIIREARQAPLLVLAHPTADGFFVHQQNLPHLQIALAPMDQQQGMTAAAFMPVYVHVFIAAHRFPVLCFTQHRASLSSGIFRSQYTGIFENPQLAVASL